MTYLSEIKMFMEVIFKRIGPGAKAWGILELRRVYNTSKTNPKTRLMALADSYMEETT